MLLKNQITMEDLILGNNVIFENEETKNEDVSKENNESCKEEMLKDKDIYVEGIHVSTIGLINEFLEEIKLSSKNDKLNRCMAIENIAKRQEAYELLFDQYHSKVLDSDKEIFSKIMNYITAESSSRSTYSDPCSNIQMYIEYKAEHKKQVVSGVYRRKDYFSTEGSLASGLSQELYDKLCKKEATPSEYFKFVDNIKIEVYSSYDIKFDLNDITILENQIKNLLNSKHFINWKFSGKRDEYQNKILSYVLGAKYEAMSHKGRGEKVYKDINVDTCRYIACLVSYTKISKYGTYYEKVSNLDEKISLYNELYPYFLEEIDENNREFFAKMANYLTFENDKYSITGYNDFANTSKESVLKRLDLLDKIDSLCKNGKITKSKKPKEFEIKTNYSKFMFTFKGGAGVSSNEEWVQKRIKTLTEILEDDRFKNWEFSGLKVESENNKELKYIDIFKEINFSEESYYILGIVLKQIHTGKSLEDRKSKKETILKLVNEYVPISDRETFKTLVDYYTNEDELGFNIASHLIRLHTDIKRKSDGVTIGRFNLMNVNKYSDITKQKVLDSIDLMYKKIMDELNEENLYDTVRLEHTIDVLNVPNCSTSSDIYLNKTYALNCFKNILEKCKCDEIEELNEAKEEVIKSEEIEESEVVIETMFDILDIIDEKEIPKTDKKNLEGQLAFLI